MSRANHPGMIDAHGTLHDSFRIGGKDGPAIVNDNGVLSFRDAGGGTMWEPIRNEDGVIIGYAIYIHDGDLIRRFTFQLDGEGWFVATGETVFDPTEGDWRPGDITIGGGTSAPEGSEGVEPGSTTTITGGDGYIGPDNDVAPPQPGGDVVVKGGSAKGALVGGGADGGGIIIIPGPGTEGGSGGKVQIWPAGEYGGNDPSNALIVLVNDDGSIEFTSERNEIDEALPPGDISIGGQTVSDVPETAIDGNSGTLKGGDGIPGSSAGAVPGGKARVKGGSAQRNTSGNANGGDVELIPGLPIGSGTPGRVYTTLPDGTKQYHDRGILPLGHFSGVGISNAVVDTEHDISIGPCSSRDSTNQFDLVLSAAMVKRIDAAWAIGTGNGGLFSGSVANNTWYHFFLIRKLSDGSIDAGFDTSASAANIPAGYVAFAMAGSVITDGLANIRQFVQTGRTTYLSTIDLNDNSLSTSAETRTLTTPPGRSVNAILSVVMVANGSNDNGVLITSTLVPDVAIDMTSGPLPQVFAMQNQQAAGQVIVRTGTASDIRTRCTGTGTALKIQTVGWSECC